MEINYSNCSPMELVAHIDVHYYDAKKKKLSRYDVEWGKWSTIMNRAIRKRIEGMDQKETECSQLKYAFNYWTVRSKLLELHFSKKRMFAKTKRRNLCEELVEIRKAVKDPHAESTKSFTQQVMEGVL